MDFFENQDRARRKTTELVLLFTAAVVMILVAVNLAAYGIMRAIQPYQQLRHDTSWDFRSGRSVQNSTFVDPLIWQQPKVYVAVSAITLLIIAGGAWYKMILLAEGGVAVARMLGGRPIDGTFEREAVLQNVVEEMSIASGVPAPQVFVLDGEESINAFAAGFTPADTVIAVSHGALTRLNRDELQGVVGHEFSHILHGDTRLNLRLIGVLNGIMVISLIGYMILSVLRYSRGGSPRYSSRSSRDNGAVVILIIIAAGAALYIIGSVGLFFGRLIQAAVSRQREFLADASSVQFTRNPAGLGGALKKIGAMGSRIRNPHAMEAAHLFFGSTLIRSPFTGLFDTHPPLAERIKAIDPTFDGRFDLGPAATEVLDQYVASRRGEALSGMVQSALDRPRGMPPRLPLAPEAVGPMAGQISPQNLNFAATMLAAIPPGVQAAAHDPFSARPVILAMLVNREAEVRQKQLRLIEQNVEPGGYRELLSLLGPVSQLGEGAWLPLLDIAMPALRRLSPQQLDRFRQIVRAIIQADSRVTLFEYTLNRLLEKRLPQSQLEAREPIEFYSVGAVKEDAAVLLSALATASTADTQKAFALAARQLDAGSELKFIQSPALQAIDTALRRLSRSSPAVKKRLIDAAACAVAADWEVSVGEAELLRATAATLDVPLPPLLSPLPPGEG